MVATLLAFVIGTQAGRTGTPDLKSAVWAELIVIAFVKVRWVMLDFMELRDAPLGLRLLGETWVIATGVLLIAHNWIVA